MSIYTTINGTFYINWTYYDRCLPSRLPVDKLTHLFYGFAVPNEDGQVIFSDTYLDTKAEVDGTLRGALGACLKLKRANPRLKLMLSIGGPGHGSEHLAQVASDPVKRRTLAVTAKEWVDKYALDGIDIAWDQPKDKIEADDFALLLRACRNQLNCPTDDDHDDKDHTSDNNHDQPALLLTCAMSLLPSTLPLYDLPEIDLHVDYLRLLAYDFLGDWSPVAGHSSQLLPPQDTGLLIPWLLTSCYNGVALLSRGGLPTTKMILGIPAYARFFPAAKKAGDNFNRHRAGSIDWRKLPREWKTASKVDTKLGAAYHVEKGVNDAKGFVSLDNPASVGIKVEWAKAKKLAGVYVWHGSADGVGGDSLSVAAWERLQRPGVVGSPAPPGRAASGRRKSSGACASLPQ